MKLRNKKTGERIEFDAILPVKDVSGDSVAHLEYGSLTELNEEWEDVPEEPKAGYIIDPMEEDCVSADDSGYEEPDVERAKELGIWFETKEEAEKAVEKLKAFANLRKRGLKFNGWDEADRGMVGEFAIYCDVLELDGIERELEIVFGREEL